MAETIQRAVEWLRGARSVTVLTGAGVSAESGLPTFRDAMTGLWAKYRPEDLATPAAFDRNPALVWQWYAWRREVVARSSPNPGHFALAEMARKIPAMTLLTQNVDGYHQLAGNEDVVELHGNIMRSKCVREHRVIDATGLVGEPPRCPACNSYLRPDVVWFGESLPRVALQRASAAAENCDVFLSIGTSGRVEPAASLMHIAADHGARTIAINIDGLENAPSGCLQVVAKSGDALPLIVCGLSE